MSEVQTVEPTTEGKKLPGAAATAAAKKAGTQGNLLADYLRTVTEGYQAAHAQALEAVEAAKAALQEALDTLAKVEAVNPNKKPVAASVKHSEPSSGQRAPRGAMQTKILELLEGKPDGLGRADLIELGGYKGNKQAESSLSNALVTMKKNGTLGYNNGLYSKP